MKILNTGTHHDNTKSMEPYFQLAVINMWDFLTKPDCFQNNTAYKLELCTPMDDKSTRHVQVTDLTVEQKQVLGEMGYTIAKAK